MLSLPITEKERGDSLLFFSLFSNTFPDESSSALQEKERNYIRGKSKRRVPATDNKDISIGRRKSVRVLEPILY